MDDSDKNQCANVLLQLHDKQLIYECSECKQTSGNEAGILEHIQQKHNIKGNFWSQFHAVSTCVVEDGIAAENNNDDENEKMWTPETVLYLIEEVKTRNDEFDKTVKRFVWVKIAEKMTTEFHKQITWKHCDTKWKALKRTYKTVLEHNNTTGKNRRQWEYFAVMHDIMFTKPDINPEATCSSYSGLVVSKRACATPTSSHSSENGDTDQENRFSIKRKHRLNAAEQRHQEKLARQDKFLELFEKLIDKI